MQNYFNTLSNGECLDLCNSGKCNADCCGCVNILESHFKRLKKFIPEGKEYFLAKVKDNGDDYVKPITSNYKCVFLTDSNSCSIYNSHLRPEVCRRFGCDSREPLFACVHINQELKSEIEDFQKEFLKSQTSMGNSVAKSILTELN